MKKTKVTKNDGGRDTDLNWMVSKGLSVEVPWN